jgi:hypothetical protein
MRTRWPRRGKDPRRRRYPSKPVGVVELDGGGSGILVVPNWDGYRLARAVRYNYWVAVSDIPQAAAPEESTLQPLLVRLPFRGLGRSPYLSTPNSDIPVVVPVEESTYPGWFTRIPFRALGSTQFRFSEANDDSAPLQSFEPIWAVRIPFAPLGRTQFRFQQPQNLNQPVDFEHSGFAVRLPFRALGRSPYLINPSQDATAVLAVEGSTACLVVLPSYRVYARNQFAISLATDAQPPDQFENTPWIFVRWMQQPYNALLAVKLNTTFTTQDDDGPAPPATVLAPYFPTYRPRRGR